MPLDPSIPLGVQTPTFDVPGIFGKAQAMKTAQVDNAAKEQAIEASKASADLDKLKMAEAHLAVTGSLLADTTPENYGAKVQYAQQLGILKPGEAPPEYDEAWIKGHVSNVAAMKEKIDQMYKLAQIEQMKSGGATGVLLDRMQREPGLRETYFGKANAGKGIVMDADGNPITMPGYNEAVSSTEEDKAEKKEIGKMRGENAANIEKKATKAPNTIALIEEARRILPSATNGLVGQMARGAAGAMGKSTESSRADRQLEVISAALVADVPRMEGPQSDYDVQLYRQAAGDIANPRVPREDRLAALETMLALQEKYRSGAESIPEGKSILKPLPMPTKRTDLIAGQSYATPRGVAVWDGEKFTQ